MGLLARVFLVSPSCSQKPLGELFCVSWLNSFHQAPPRYRVRWGRVGSCVCSSILCRGFSCNEYKPLELEGIFLHFCHLLSEDDIPGGPWDDKVGGFPHLWILLSGYGRLCNAATFCTTSLPLTLSSASMCASHPGQIAVSAPQFAQDGLCFDPLLLSCPRATASTRPHLWLPSLTFAPSVSPVHSDTPTFICLNIHISQTFVCVGQGILCWIIAVQRVVTSRGGIWRSSHTAMLLISLHSALKWVLFWCVWFLWGSIKHKTLYRKPLAPV